MKSIPYLVCILVALCLPCVETSECLSLSDDAFNDVDLGSSAGRINMVIERLVVEFPPLNAARPAPQLSLHSTDPERESFTIDGSAGLSLISIQKK
jgi:hypothetical protein